MGSSGRLAGALSNVSQPYTPTTQEVQWAATTTTFEDSCITEDAFNRWLDARDARIEAAAEQRGKEQGWDEAITAQIQRLVSGDPDVGRFHMPANPYRADQMEGDDE